MQNNYKIIKISQLKKFLWCFFFYIIILSLPKIGKAQLSLNCTGSCIKGSDCSISLSFTCPAGIPPGTNCLVTGNMPPIGSNAQCGAGGIGSGTVMFSGSSYPASGQFEVNLTCLGRHDNCAIPIQSTPGNNNNSICEPGESGLPDCDGNCDPTTECDSSDCADNALCNSGGCSADGNCNTGCAGAGFADPDCTMLPPDLPPAGPSGKICAGVPPPPPNPKLCENIVRCGGCWEPPCNLCHIFETISNIINCILRLAFLIGAVLIVFGGMLILLSGFYPNLRQQGKTIFTAVIYGLIIAMLSYIIVFTIVSLFAQNMADFSFSASGFSFTCQAYQ